MGKPIIIWGIFLKSATRKNNYNGTLKILMIMIIIKRLEIIEISALDNWKCWYALKKWTKPWAELNIPHSQTE